VDWRITAEFPGQLRKHVDHQSRVLRNWSFHSEQEMPVIYQALLSRTDLSYKSKTIKGNPRASLFQKEMVCGDIEVIN
jgi:hypothetical protein